MNNHPLANYANFDGTIDIIRCVNDDFSSQNGFRYPESGPVVCPDWNPHEGCGNGLHGWVWAAHHLLNGRPGYVKKDGKWLVIRCQLEDVIEIEGDKVKLRCGEVIKSGTLDECIELLAKPAEGRVEAWGVAQCGPNASLSGGYGSTVSGGDGSTVSGGDGSTVSGGDGSTVSGGYGSTVSGGDGSTVSGGYGSTVSGGDGSTVSGGSRSTVSGGYGSTVSGGYGSTVSAPWGCALVLWGYDTNGKYRSWVAVAGVTRGVKADTPYRLVSGKFVEVKP